jgi:hypothetical protein
VEPRDEYGNINPDVAAITDVTLVPADSDDGRGSHPFTSQLNLSALYGIGGARRDCVARVKGVLGDVQGV